MSIRQLVYGMMLALTLVFIVSCGGKESEEQASKQLSGPVYTPTGNEGSLSGLINFSGAAPAPKKLQMDSDPVCAQKSTDAVSEEIIVQDGKLQNVFVYVKSGLPQNTFTASSQEVVLDQVGCRYVPHVLGIQTNQPLKILNSDATSHNVHPVAKKNREWNENQYPSAPPIVKKFPLEEVLIPVKCNQHSWMKAYIGVLSHPFFAVSGPDGSFTIKGLPPGEYELEAWHEKLGAKMLKISVKEKDEVKVNFTFEATMTYRAGSLKVQPALIL